MTSYYPTAAINCADKCWFCVPFVFQGVSNFCSDILFKLQNINVDNWRSLFLRRDSGDSINHLNYHSSNLRSKRFRLVSEQKETVEGDFRFLIAREIKREPKNERGGRGRAIFRAVFDSCSSFFVPKPHRNACYAGYHSSYAPTYLGHDFRWRWLSMTCILKS